MAGLAAFNVRNVGRRIDAGRVLRGECIGYKW